jgi:hypothetical protein
MHKDDGIIYYSSKIVFGQDEKCQCFTAIGTVADDTVVQADMGEGFLPFRRHVRFFACQETPIAPLIPHLSFIKDKHHWAGVFRFGLVEIPETDYLLIANHMGVQSPASVA